MSRQRQGNFRPHPLAPSLRELSSISETEGVPCPLNTCLKGTSPHLRRQGESPFAFPPRGKVICSRRHSGGSKSDEGKSSFTHTTDNSHVPPLSPPTPPREIHPPSLLLLREPPPPCLPLRGRCRCRNAATAVGVILPPHFQRIASHSAALPPVPYKKRDPRAKGKKPLCA